jgi:hypothetical protein
MLWIPISFVSKWNLCAFNIVNVFWFAATELSSHVSKEIIFTQGSCEITSEKEVIFMHNLLAPFNSSSLFPLALNQEWKSKCCNAAPERVYISQQGRANVKTVRHLIPEIG